MKRRDFPEVELAGTLVSMDTELKRSRPKGRSGLADWYARVLAAQRGSGQSVSAFARELGITPATLYQWRRRLEGEEEDLGVAGDASDDPGLVRVSIRETRRGGSDGEAFTVHIGTQRSIEVRGDFDATELQRLVRALESC